MTLKDHSTEAERLIQAREAEAEKWVASIESSFRGFPGGAGNTLRNIVRGAFMAGYLSGVERTSALLARRMDQLEKIEPGRKDYGDGGDGPTN